MSRDAPNTPKQKGVRGVWAAMTSTRGFRRIAALNVALLWLIIPSGGIVRLTGSGLGCTDWPLCDNGGIIPAWEANAWIESTNRVASGVVMAFAVIVAVAAFRAVGRTHATSVAATIAAVATVGQVPLGAVTVIFDLHPILVGSHFVLSLVALAAGVIAFLGADDVLKGITRRCSGRWTVLAGLAATALSATLVTGVLTTAAGPHSGDSAVIRRFGVLDDAAYVHVRAVIALLIVAVVVAWGIWRRRGDRDLVVPALLFIPLFAAQVVIGEIQWRNELPWQIVVAHVAVAGLVWGTGIATAWRIARPLAASPSRF